MIKLSHTPYEGSAFKLNLSFKDSYGNYYVPLSANYSLLALNNDKESWSVVDNIYEKQIQPLSSSVVLTIQKLNTVLNATNQRKLRICWTAFVDGMTTDFIDEVDFELKPKPYITDQPTPTPPDPFYVQVTDVDLQIGTIKNTPREPIFIAKTNVPVNISEAVFKIILDEQEITPNVLIDSTKTKLTINPDGVLKADANYILHIEGLVSVSNDYVMKAPYETVFHVTDSVLDIQELSDAIKDHEERIEQNESDITELKERVTQTEQDILNINDTLNDYHTRIDNNTENIEINKQSIKDIKELYDTLDVQVVLQNDKINEVHEELYREVGKINALIPEEASTLNQLADKKFVKDEVKGLNGKCWGHFNSESELPTEGVENHDYAYVDGEFVVKLYEYNGTEWVYAYNVTEVVVIANPEEEPTEELKSIKVDSTVYEIPKVIGNSTEEPTEELKNIQIKDKTFKIIEVVGNSTEEPTEELKSIKVDSTVYKLPEVEKETELIDFSTWEGYEPSNVVDYASIENETLVLTEKSNLKTTGNTITIDGYKMTVKDDKATEDINGLQDELVCGEGLVIDEDGIIHLV